MKRRKPRQCTCVRASTSKPRSVNPLQSCGLVMPMRAWCTDTSLKVEDDIVFGFHSQEVFSQNIIDDKDYFKLVEFFVHRLELF